MKEVILLYTIRFFLTSIIFILGAYYLQILSEKYRWKSEFADKTRNTFTYLSVFSLLSSVLIQALS